MLKNVVIESKFSIIILVSLLSLVVLIINGCTSKDMMRQDLSFHKDVKYCHTLIGLNRYNFDDKSAIARFKRDSEGCLRYLRQLESGGLLIKQEDTLESNYLYNNINN